MKYKQDTEDRTTKLIRDWSSIRVRVMENLGWLEALVFCFICLDVSSVKKNTAQDLNSGNTEVNLTIWSLDCQVDQIISDSISLVDWEIINNFISNYNIGNFNQLIYSIYIISQGDKKVPPNDLTTPIVHYEFIDSTIIVDQVLSYKCVCPLAQWAPVMMLLPL